MTVLRRALARWLAAVLLLLGAHEVAAQSGGSINSGSGHIGDPFVLHKVSCTLTGDGKTTTEIEALGARWRPIGATNWYKSTDKLYLPPAIYRFEFKPAGPLFRTPAIQQREVKGTLTFTAQYKKRS